MLTLNFHYRRWLHTVVLVWASVRSFEVEASTTSLLLHPLTVSTQHSLFPLLLTRYQLPLPLMIRWQMLLVDTLLKEIDQEVEVLAIGQVGSLRELQQLVGSLRELQTHTISSWCLGNENYHPSLFSLSHTHSWTMIEKSPDLAPPDDLPKTPWFIHLFTANIWITCDHNTLRESIIKFNN